MSGVVTGERPGHRERLPLEGLSVVVTRPEHQAGDLADRLVAAGADPGLVPAIAIADAADGGAALEGAARRVGEYDWVILTSANAARRLLAHVGDAGDFETTKVAAIGDGTSSALEDRQVRVDLVPAESVAEDLLAALPDPPTEGGRILLARAAVARDVLPDGLRERGWTVDVVDAYRTVTANIDESALSALSSADVVTFTSSSTVTRHLEQVGGPASVTAAVACIGPVTASTARLAGLTVTIEAPIHTVGGLVDALVEARAAGVLP